jgi:hypothetical protein
LRVAEWNLIPADHPIRRIRKVVEEVLASLDSEFEAMYFADRPTERLAGRRVYDWEVGGFMDSSERIAIVGALQHLEVARSILYARLESETLTGEQAFEVNKLGRIAAAAQDHQSAQGTLTVGDVRLLTGPYYPDSRGAGRLYSTAAQEETRGVFIREVPHGTEPHESLPVRLTRRAERLAGRWRALHPGEQA